MLTLSMLSAKELNKALKMKLDDVIYNIKKN